MEVLRVHRGRRGTAQSGVLERSLDLPHLQGEMFRCPHNRLDVTVEKLREIPWPHESKRLFPPESWGSLESVNHRDEITDMIRVYMGEKDGVNGFVTPASPFELQQ
jgi:hypothetical protein